MNKTSEKFINQVMQILACKNVINECLNNARV